jgi:thiamine-phosphate pyrophosphorylase
MSVRDLTDARREHRCAAARPSGRGAAVPGVGVDIVQLRDKRLSDDELAAVADDACRLCRRLGALFIVNDRPTVALEIGADGAHVGQEDMPVAQVREVIGPDLLVGLSTHTPAEIDAVGKGDPALSAATPLESVIDRRHATPDPVQPWLSTGAPLGSVVDGLVDVDYIGVGPVHATPTKPGRPAVGLALVRHAATHARVPFFAIGGIDGRNLATVIQAGAQRVAVVRAVALAADPERAARVLRIPLDAHPLRDTLVRATCT